MIRSLRSLCLLKVYGEEMDYEGLPPGLVRDLNVMNLFNGNFSSERSPYDDDEGEHLELSALEVLYDGVSWSFSSRSASMPIYCCYTCNVCQPRLSRLMVTEGELFRTRSLFSQVREWFAKMENNYDAQFKKLDTEIVVDVGQDELSGTITFHGTGELVSFNVTVEVNISAGSRVMVHRGTASRGSETMVYVNTLSETTVSAENVFAEYNPGYDELEEEIDEAETVPAVKEDSSSDYSKHVDGFKEFWEMIEKLSV